ncbi:MAG: HipA domain-containing protein [Oscillospiraceae bacterium]|nr:HipA domain-containing protein [Oscillospiraceae bacterium]
MNIADEPLWDIRELVWSRSSGSIATDGVFMKTDLMLDGEKHYLKLSNYDSYRGIYGHEAVNELIAIRLGELLGFNVPSGELRRSLVRIDEKEHEAYVFMAKSFKTTESRISFEDFYLDNRLSDAESPFELCIRFNWASEIYMMFVFDYLIINRDRHGANLEVLKNDIKKLSPLFDNGLSLLCSCFEERDLQSFNIMEDRPVNNFIGSKRLEENLQLINMKLPFEILQETDKEKLFYGLKGVLPESYFIMIWEIIWRRWDNVEKFRID